MKSHYNIDKRSYAVIAQADQSLNFEAKWIVSKNDFKDVLQFQIKEVELQQLFIQGETRDDLLKNVDITEAHNEIMISYKNHNNSKKLEQLQESLSIWLNVNHRIFNLMLDY